MEVFKTKIRIVQIELGNLIMLQEWKWLTIQNQVLKKLYGLFCGHYLKDTKQ